MLKGIQVTFCHKGLHGFEGITTSVGKLKLKYCFFVEMQFEPSVFLVGCSKRMGQFWFVRPCKNCPKPSGSLSKKQLPEETEKSVGVWYPGYPFIFRNPAFFTSILHSTCV